MAIIDYKEQIIKSLENPEYHWRTVSGISRELNISESLVSRALLHKDLENILVNCSRKTKDGKELYTTRKHYKATQPLANKILTALSGEIR